MKVIDYQDYLKYVDYFNNSETHEILVNSRYGSQYYRNTNTIEIYTNYISGYLYCRNKPICFDVGLSDEFERRFFLDNFHFNFEAVPRTPLERVIFEKQIQRIKKLERINE